MRHTTFLVYIYIQNKMAILFGESEDQMAMKMTQITDRTTFVKAHVLREAAPVKTGALGPEAVVSE